MNAVLASDITYTLVDTADEYWAGFANVVTGGLSNQIREAIYGSSVRCNQQGFVYNLGQVGGVVNTIALGFVSPTQLGAGLSFAQKFALGYEVTNTGVGAYSSTQNILEGKATGWDALSFLPLANYGSQKLRSLDKVNNAVGALDNATEVNIESVLFNPNLYGSDVPVTSLWRAVQDGELIDIRNSTIFKPSPTGAEVKYFASTPEGASSYARQAYTRWPHEGQYTIVETSIPNEFITPDMLIEGGVDRGIPTYTIPNELLPYLNPPSVYNSSPLP